MSSTAWALVPAPKSWAPAGMPPMMPGSVVMVIRSEIFSSAATEATRRLGAVEAVDDLARAVRGAWMVVEAVPENLDLKKEILGELDRLADADAILGSNSSSLPTSTFIDKVEHTERVLNTHYQMPPDLNAVELMSDGRTDESIIDALIRTLPRYGFVPFHVRRESDGFIMNRIWASIKRECLMVVEEGVAPPEDVDRMWQLFKRKASGHASHPVAAGRPSPAIGLRAAPVRRAGGSRQWGDRGPPRPCVPGTARCSCGG